MTLAEKQTGLSTVEFALVAAVLFTMMFGVIEIARAFFVSSALDEATRRGARMAAVCPVNDPAIFQAAAFNNTLILISDDAPGDRAANCADGSSRSGVARE